MVCTEALSEPAPGSVRAKLVIDLARGDARQPFGLLGLASGHHQALAADADIGAEGGAEGGRGAAELERDPHLLGHGQAEAAIFLRDGEAEQPHLPHLGDDLGRHLVLPVDPLLERTKPLADEAADGGEEQVEGFGVEGHWSLSVTLNLLRGSRFSGPQPLLETGC